MSGLFCLNLPWGVRWKFWILLSLARSVLIVREGMDRLDRQRIVKGTLTE